MKHETPGQRCPGVFRWGNVSGKWRLPIIPAGPIAGWTGLHPFVPALHIGHLASAALAWWIARRAGSAGRPFAIVAAVIVLQSAAFETMARAETWTGIVRAIAGFVPAPLALATMLATGIALALGWRARPIQTHRAPAV